MQKPFLISQFWRVHKVIKVWAESVNQGSKLEFSHGIHWGMRIPKLPNWYPNWKIIHIKYTTCRRHFGNQCCVPVFSLEPAILTLHFIYEIATTKSPHPPPPPHTLYTLDISTQFLRGPRAEYVAKIPNWNSPLFFPVCPGGVSPGQAVDMCINLMFNAWAALENLQNLT